ncbi:bifunctional phosphopantothenoylcysteine decarboxylase/phosphopantothenate--cysteine ligase CoaBC [Weissella coleopterorum]|uniref:Coenzyme A biosynthesis bifunctional protein CoaBC n=1 Tax=Weissella coleopterorum TaxID=2714949 RepID=A0A6G8B0V6_9LACO|nr:bifunctional phosphopantothenoylcysteine decarboxylase/phosphopantothenate--cysteine ligase CoaBC [Weissella coleopterorum]QIL50938.1 bifunctional phosphopantothenoylcysteine decarboxylase/phosphopantothenate--cysteine ligase CoaBC [Weissella coleopterorum]
MFKDKKIVLIVTGGIAAYKAAVFVRLLIKAGAAVQVVMTASAQEFVTEKTFAVLTKRPVLTDLFKETATGKVPHIELADWADLMFVVPATANIISKIAQGIGDDVASTLLLARHTPLLVAPAMNENMYHNPAIQRNLDQLRADQVIILEPTYGMLAEGYAGMGRLPEPEVLFEQAEINLRQQQKTPLAGKNYLVTAGGTKEALDPVRFIGNRSSGKMGYALAQALVEAGAQVTLISTVDLKAPWGVKVVTVQTAHEMEFALEQRFDQSDGLVMAAAVADFRAAQVATQKIKKNNGQGLELQLTQNPDLIAHFGAKKGHQKVIAFAAETNDLITHAQAKLKKKNADLLIANDVSKSDRGFGVDQNQVTLIEPGQPNVDLPLLSKIETARAIVKRIIQLTAREN